MLCVRFIGQFQYTSQIKLLLMIQDEHSFSMCILHIKEKTRPSYVSSDSLLSIVLSRLFFEILRGTVTIFLAATTIYTS
jgi:hypothetical protein